MNEEPKEEVAYGEVKCAGCGDIILRGAGFIATDDGKFYCELCKAEAF